MSSKKIPIIIREGTEEDLLQVNDIYHWHSENGFSTFLEPTGIEQRRSWFRNFQENDRQIFLVADDGVRVLGTACSFTYRNGGVFKDTLETSIYLHHEARGIGLGTKLYSALFEKLQFKGIHRVVVGIALPNEASIQLHKKFGFEEIGVFDEYAYYKGAYRSSLWMQRKMKGKENYD